MFFLHKKLDMFVYELIEFVWFFLFINFAGSNEPIANIHLRSFL